MADESANQNAKPAADPGNNLMFKAAAGIFGTVLAPVLVAMGMKFSDAFVSKVTDSAPTQAAKTDAPTPDVKPATVDGSKPADVPPVSTDKPAVAVSVAPPLSTTKAPDGVTVDQSDSATPDGGLPGQWVIKMGKDGGESWTYSTQSPMKAWAQLSFPARKWATGKTPFGSPGVKLPGRQAANTEWSTREIWLRKKIVLPPEIVGARVRWHLLHDEPIEIYVNGELFKNSSKATGKYHYSAGEAKLLKPGENVIAVHAINLEGAGMLDIGLAFEPRAK